MRQNVLQVSLDSTNLQMQISDQQQANQIKITFGKKFTKFPDFPEKIIFSLIMLMVGTLIW